MTYGKEIHAIILTDFAKGATAEETQKHLQDALNVKPCTNTIYKHRGTFTIDQVVDELARQQERDITKEENSDIRMHYRNELLKLFVPVKIIQLNKNLNVNRTEIKIDVPDLLKQYEDLFEEATILENCAPQPLHKTETNNETGNSTST